MALAFVLLMTTLAVGLNQIEASPNDSRATRSELVELLRRLLEDETATDFAAGADTDGLFQKCVCMTPARRDCTCSGHIGTGVWSTMHSAINDQGEYFFVVTVNQQTVFDKDENPVQNGAKLCSADTTFGSTDDTVKICQRLYHVHPPSGSTDSPKGCNDVEVSFNGGCVKTYTECFPGTPAK